MHNELKLFAAYKNTYTLVGVFGAAGLDFSSLSDNSSSRLDDFPRRP